jgi:hypothetical protein
MRGLVLASLLLLMGCTGITGPRGRDYLDKRVDRPYVPIPDQRDRASANLAYPQTGYNLGPRTYAEIPAEQYGRLSH